MANSLALDSIARPIVALADEYGSGFVDPRHSHRRGQLLYATSGVLAVSTSQGSYLVPPTQAVWVPANIEHEVACSGTVSLRTLYVEPLAVATMPGRCCVLEVRTLLRALILEAMTFEPHYDMAGREGRIAGLLLDELASMKFETLQTPMPQDRRLLCICHAIIADPANQADLDEWADRAGVGRRTMTRRFRQETGMSLAGWRQHLRVVAAAARLAAGQSVTSVCYEVGYDSLSAFTTVFQKIVGVSPSVYAMRSRQSERMAWASLEP